MDILKMHSVNFSLTTLWKYIKLSYRSTHRTNFIIKNQKV